MRYWRRAWRRNADEPARRIERESFEDPRARERWIRDRVRAGRIHDLTLRDLLDFPEAMWELDHEDWAQLVNWLSLTSQASQKDWFPGHKRADVCPRGHRLGERVAGPRSARVHFYLNELGAVSVGYEVVDVDEDEDEGGGVVMVSGLPETETSDAFSVLACDHCGANWPLGEFQMDHV